MIDLHTDLLTCDISNQQKQDFLAKAKKDGHQPILAIFTHDKIGNINYSGYKIGIEDCSKISFEQCLSYNPIYVSLCWNYDNNLCGGALGDCGLTNEGRKIIQKLNAYEIVVDLAHQNRKSFFDSIDICEKVIVSHTCFCAIKDHKRNLTDDQISLITQRNGIVGLTFVSGFLAQNKATVSDVIRHIDHFCSKFSYKNLAIGTDFFGTPNGVEGINDYNDCMKIVFQLEKMGYSKTVIDSIFTLNAKNFFKI